MPRSIRIVLAVTALFASAAPNRSFGQAATKGVTPPSDIHFRRTNIISEGTRMSAEALSLKALDGKKLPTIILCHGWGGLARDLRPESIAFAQAGYLAIAIDYRGWGESDARLVQVGPTPKDANAKSYTIEVKPIREVVDPLDQTTDLANAVHWAHGEPQCDAAKIGLWGSSYSGGHVAYVAARDRRVKAIVAQVPALDSRWVVFAPNDRALTFGEATKRARGELGYPEAGGRVIGNLRGAPIRARMINYAPVDDIEKAGNCAMLFILAEKEELFDNKDHGLKAFERAKGPKKLVTIPGIMHYGIYGSARPQAQSLAIAWFDEHLKGTKPAAPPQSSNSDKDWPMYNRDVVGSRFNRGETAISPATAPKLEVKWRFPADEADRSVGVIHATPSVVNGYVYFGTATNPTFYKLAPDGKVRWTYRNAPSDRTEGESKRGSILANAINSLRGAQLGGIMNSALVTADAVYFGDVNGLLYSLDRMTGKERWKIDTRSKEFPDAHEWNFIHASPIEADGKIIMAGGPFEHLAAVMPGYQCCTGRGFLVALEPKTGKIVWKYDVGPKPQRLSPPVVINDARGQHKFDYGPSTSSVWSTPSFDAATGMIYFGSDSHNSPRQPTSDDPRLYNQYSCAIIALDAKTGAEKWVTQLNPDDVWNYGLRAYDPVTGRYKDNSIGDTPKIYTIERDGKPVKVVGAGSKNGAFYVLHAADGKVLEQTPVYDGPPDHPLSSPRDPRTLALPSPIGGLQTGCATDGATVFTNGIDAIRLGTLGAQEKGKRVQATPTAGRVVAISSDTRKELWRHERPQLATIGGPPPRVVYTNVGDPVASGIAVANGVLFFTTVASGKLVALDAATGGVLKEVDLGPVWSGPSVSRGRVYVGTGNTLFSADNAETYLPKKYTGVLYSIGLPGEDEVSRLGAGNE